MGQLRQADASFRQVTQSCCRVNVKEARSLLLPISTLISQQLHCLPSPVPSIPHSFATGRHRKPLCRQCQQLKHRLMHQINLTGKVHKIEGFSGGCKMFATRMERVEVAATRRGRILTTGKERGDQKVMLAAISFLPTIDGGLGG